MPKYKVRLDDPNSDEFRIHVFHAMPDAETAKAKAEEWEQNKVAYTLPQERLDLAARAEAGEVVVDAPRKGELLTHAQTEPYEVTSVEKVTTSPTKAIIAAVATSAAPQPAPSVRPRATRSPSRRVTSR